MESMIIKSGWILAACVKICSRCVSHKMKQFGLSCDNRSARSFNWRLLSSPETYRVFKPVKPNTVCKTKVDFPIPGSPPIKTKEPFTKPPPRTLFNSSSFKSIRASSSVVISRHNTGNWPLHGRLLCYDLLYIGVPLPTIRAFTQPFRGISATVRADIYGFCFRHSILNLA